MLSARVYRWWLNEAYGRKNEGEEGFEMFWTPAPLSLLFCDLFEIVLSAKDLYKFFKINKAIFARQSDKSSKLFLEKVG